MNGITDFFAFIISPVQSFVSETFAQFRAASNFVLDFLLTFLQGIMNVVQAILDLLNFGNY